MVHSRTNRFAKTGMAAGLVGLVFGLSACVGGTTYGTGVTQEQQTVEDVYNMFTLKKKRNNIDYSARPDLIVPENTAALPEPLENGVATSNPEWPETPEERIARIRSQAGEEDPRTGLLPVEERTRKKDGIRIETRDPEAENRAAGLDRKGNPIVGFHSRQHQKEKRARVLSEKDKLKLKTGAQRRYLTEPPVEYRIPADSAPTGEEAYTEKELAERKAIERKKKELARKEMRVRGTPLSY